MIVTHKLSMDLALHSAPLLHMVQGEISSRWIEFSLYSNKRPWPVPRDTAVLIRYKKANSASGIYDTLSGGLRAWRFQGNRLCIAVAPEVVSLPGTAFLTVSLVLGQQELSTFQVQLNIQSNYTGDAFPADEPARITGLLPAPDSAQPGQYLKVEETDEQGHILRMTAEDLPLPTATSQLTNDSGFLTSAVLVTQYTTTDGTTWTGDHSYAQLVAALEAGKQLFAAFDVYRVPLVSANMDGNGGLGYVLSATMQYAAMTALLVHCADDTVLLQMFEDDIDNRIDEKLGVIENGNY